MSSSVMGAGGSAQGAQGEQVSACIIILFFLEHELNCHLEFKYFKL